MIPRIAEALVMSTDPSAACSQLLLDPHMPRVPGNWIIGRSYRGIIHTVIGGTAMDMDILPAQCEIFGVTSSFDVFPKGRTAHVYSDIGLGCIYSCAFCSESSKVNGPLQRVSSAAIRLKRQLAAASSTIRSQDPSAVPSAFVEDSVLLGGRQESLQQLAQLLATADDIIPFGAQLTIDLILRYKDILPKLRTVGLSYLFVGLESVDPSVVATFSKNRRKLDDSWRARAECAFQALAENGIGCGVALLFGLGESAASRKQIFEHLCRWRQRYGIPTVVSINWAVQHPLQGSDGGTEYTYLEWGTDVGPLLDIVQHFGEAAERYPLAGVSPVSLAEASEVVDLLQHFYQATQ